MHTRTADADIIEAAFCAAVHCENQNKLHLLPFPPAFRPTQGIQPHRNLYAL